MSVMTDELKFKQLPAQEMYPGIRDGEDELDWLARKMQERGTGLVFGDGDIKLLENCFNENKTF